MGRAVRFSSGSGLHSGRLFCNVDGLTFSNIVVNTTVSNGGSVTLGNFTPVNPAPGESVVELR